MRTSFWREVWESFKSVNGNLIAIVLFIAGIGLSPYFGWKYSVLFILVVFLILSNGVFANLAQKLYYENDFLPKVLRFEIIGSKVICLTEASKVFSFGSIVSMYFKREGFEELIAIGEVYNIQEDGKIQIKINKFITEKDNIKKEIENNSKDLINYLLVKPNCPKEIIYTF